eukprot:TRINITY_DN30701_c0_g1_i1.p1 TRINITY_DN30701_c0_g1~~TRINITY_DN30701_c0_g1_i1.p1  ORF type:complete len:128 (+),score=14.03 TRINITY_DN30701_c0_g1_i1:35-418(+)
MFSLLFTFFLLVVSSARADPCNNDCHEPHFCTRIEYRCRTCDYNCVKRYDKERTTLCNMSSWMEENPSCSTTDSVLLCSFSYQGKMFQSKTIDCIAWNKGVAVCSVLHPEVKKPTGNRIFLTPRTLR